MPPLLLPAAIPSNACSMDFQLQVLARGRTLGRAEDRSLHYSFLLQYTNVNILSSRFIPIVRHENGSVGSNFSASVSLTPPLRVPPKMVNRTDSAILLLSIPLLIDWTRAAFGVPGVRKVGSNDLEY